MNYYIGIDIGTSGTKSVLFDTSGNEVKSASADYDILSNLPGYAEEDPQDWKNAVLKTLKELSSAFPPSKIKGIGLSGQMHGLVMLDKNGCVLYNSIIWCDNRTAKEAIDIAAFKKIKEITGNEAMPAFTLAKLLWVRKNLPDIYNKIDKILLPKDYIRYILTGEIKTEYSDASGMQLMDIEREDWSDEVLEFFDIPRLFLPEICDSNEITGYLTEEVSKITGLSKDTFVVGGAGDQAAGAIGNGIITPQDASIVLGSSGVVFSSVDKLEKKSNIGYFHHAVRGIYHTMGVTNGCGNSLKWYRDYMCSYEDKEAKELGISTYDYITRNIDNIPAGTNGLIYLPYLMGERTPNLAPNATGMFIGIRGNTTKDMMTRAILEGISYSIRDCFNALDVKATKVLISGGGAKNPKWCNILSSVLNTPISKTSVSEAPALGVAILAMVAGGEYKSEVDAAKSIIKITDTYYPNASDSKAYDAFYEVYRRMYEQNKLLFDITEGALK